MDFLIHIDTISMDMSILYFKGSQDEICTFQYISSHEDCFYLRKKFYFNYYVPVTIFSVIMGWVFLSLYQN